MRRVCCRHSRPIMRRAAAGAANLLPQSSSSGTTSSWLPAPDADTLAPGGDAATGLGRRGFTACVKNVSQLRNQPTK